jgi:hypothetical protein
MDVLGDLFLRACHHFGDVVMPTCGIHKVLLLLAKLRSVLTAFCVGCVGRVTCPTIGVKRLATLLVPRIKTLEGQVLESLDEIRRSRVQPVLVDTRPASWFYESIGIWSIWFIDSHRSYSR